MRDSQGNGCLTFGSDAEGLDLLEEVLDGNSRVISPAPAQVLTIEIDETGAVFGDEGLGFGYHGIHADWWTYELSLTETAGRLGAHTNMLMPPLRARLAAASTLYERRALCQLLESWGAAATPEIPDPIGLLGPDAAAWAWIPSSPW